MQQLLWQSMWARRGNVLGALIAVVIATTIAFASVILIRSAVTGVRATDRQAATTFVVRMNPANGSLPTEDQITTMLAIGIDPALAERISGVPGVTNVIPDVQQDVTLLRTDGTVIAPPDRVRMVAQGWGSAGLTPFTLAEGRAPAAGDEIVIDRALATQAGLVPGDEVLLSNGAVPQVFRIVGIVTPSDRDRLEGQLSIFLQDAAITAFIGRREVDSLGVIVSPDADLDVVRGAIVTALGDPRLEVLAGNARGQVDITSGSLELSDFIAMLGSMSGFSGFVAIFVLSSTFAFSVLQRSREIGLQRAIGVTPGQVRRLIAMEAMVHAVLGTAIGVLLGTGLAQVVARIAARVGLVPASFRVTFWWWAVPIVLGSALVVTLVAVWGSSRRAARIRPVDALREAALPQRAFGIWRILIGVMFFAGGGAMVVLASQVPMEIAVLLALGEAIVLMIGASVLGPIIVLLPLLVLNAVAGRIWRTPGELAGWNMRRAAKRVASTVTPIMLATGFAALMFGFTTTAERGTVAQSRERTTADIVVVGDTGVPTSLVDDLAGVDGVAAVMPLVSAESSIVVDHGDWQEAFDVTAGGVDPSTVADVLALDMTSGDLAAFTDESVLLGSGGDIAFGGKPGDTVTLLFPDGELVTFTVAGTFGNGLGLPDVLLPMRTLAAHDPGHAVDAVFISLADDAPTDVAAKLEAVAPTGVSLHALTAGAYVGTLQQAIVSGAWILYVIIGAAVVFAAISVVNTLVMSIADRVREFSLLRLIGATGGQVETMMLAESLMCAMIGLPLGLGIALIALISVSQGLTGSVTHVGVPLLPTLLVIVIATGVTVGAHMIPTRFALRRDPVEAIGLKQ